MMSFFVNMAEKERDRDPSLTYFRLLDERNGCVNGCRCGVGICETLEYPEELKIGGDQEGFVVLEGRGFAKVGDEERSIAPGDAFIVPASIACGIKALNRNEPLRMLYFHAAI